MGLSQFPSCYVPALLCWNQCNCNNISQRSAPLDHILMHLNQYIYLYQYNIHHEWHKNRLWKQLYSAPTQVSWPNSTSKHTSSHTYLGEEQKICRCISHVLPHVRVHLYCEQLMNWRPLDVRFASSSSYFVPTDIPTLIAFLMLYEPISIFDFHNIQWRWQ